jgi:4-diphosphocytidyl-2-C-methyl-D-erythritol kinase
VIALDAPAKINLGLHVLGRRDDGFHELRTLMLTVSLCDRLTVAAGAGHDARTQLTVAGADLPTGGENLVVRSVNAMRALTGRRDDVAIHLSKQIPVGAGLGGGSSDAAATLTALNEMWDAGLSPTQLATTGATLGSDVPFFFHAPAALCEGRGERVRPISADLALNLVLLFPRIEMSTPAVYRALNAPSAPPASVETWVAGSTTLSALRQADPATFVRGHNDLEAAARRVSPALDGVFTRTAGLKFETRFLSGSGSTLVFGTRDQAGAQQLADEIRGAALGEVFVVRSHVGTQSRLQLQVQR